MSTIDTWYARASRQSYKLRVHRRLSSSDCSVNVGSLWAREICVHWPPNDRMGGWRTRFWRTRTLCDFAGCVSFVTALSVVVSTAVHTVMCVIIACGVLNGVWDDERDIWIQSGWESARVKRQVEGMVFVFSDRFFWWGSSAWRLLFTRPVWICTSVFQFLNHLNFVQLLGTVTHR